MNEGTEPGIPDGLKVDNIGRVYCTGPAASGCLRPMANAWALFDGRSKP